MPSLSNPERVIYLVDGFNVYWSIVGAIQAGVISRGKWFDIKQFAEKSLSLVPDFSPNAQLVGVHYFSAYAGFLNQKRPGTTARHKSYTDALNAVGVTVTMGRYKIKDLTCKATCREPYRTHEEKETDVNLGIHLLDYFYQDACDTIVLVSGDSDLVPALKLAKKRFPHKRLGVAIPYNKKGGDDLKPPTSDFTFRISASLYKLYQLPLLITSTSGQKIECPTEW